jgi:hypothetical protein
VDLVPLVHTRQILVVLDTALVDVWQQCILAIVLAGLDAWVWDAPQRFLMRLVQKSS